MKVLCINNKSVAGHDIDSPELTVGETYNAIDELEYLGELYYVLSELSMVTWYGTVAYNKKCFIPCSDIDETELINQKELTA